MAKPSTSATVNTGHALGANLAAAFLLNEGTGSPKDYVTGTLLTLAGGAAWSANGLTLASTGARAGATTPAPVRLTLPITLYVRVIPTSTLASQNAVYFGINHNDADASPFDVAAIGMDSANHYRADGNTGGSFLNISSSLTPTSDAGATVDLAFVATTAGWALYRNGTQIASSPSAKGDPTYGTTSRIGFGWLAGTTRNSQCEAVFGYVWHADQSANLATIQADPYAMFSAGRPRIWTGAGLVQGSGTVPAIWTGAGRVQ